MNVDSYTDRLESMDAMGITSELIESLSCPIDWTTEPSMNPIVSRLHEKWFHTVGDFLPGAQNDLRYLRGDDGAYLGIPGNESFDWLELADTSALTPASLDDAKRIASSAFCVRDRYRHKYASDCSRLLAVRAQTCEERAKHYALSAKTSKDLVNLSLKKKDIGLMLPNLTPRVQEYAFWLAVADLFERKLWELEDSDSDDSYEAYRKRFDTAWQDHLGNPKSFRISLDAMTTVGYQNGLEARWLIFDVSLHAKQFHCYPAVEPIQELPEAAVDDLQGLAEFFENQQEFPTEITYPVAS